MSHTLPPTEALGVLREELAAEDLAIKLDHPAMSETVCTNCGQHQPVLRSLARI